MSRDSLPGGADPAIPYEIRPMLHANACHAPFNKAASHITAVQHGLGNGQARRMIV
jgi:hypothetical protein